LRWSSTIAGLFNATSGLDAFTAPVTGVSVAILSSSTGSGINHTSFSSTSTSTLKNPSLVSIVTVTDRTTVTETNCSASSTAISLDAASTLPTSSIEENVVKSTVPAIYSVPKSTLAPAVNITGTASLSSALVNEQILQSTVVIITKTAWTATWTSVTVQVSRSTKGSHSSVDKDSIDGNPQQPIDQLYAKPIPSPTITSIKPQTPILTKPTTSCTSNGTASLGVAGNTSTTLQVTSPLPTVHTGLPVFGTAGTKIPKVSQSPHHTSKLPIIPNLPFGHPPAFFNGTIVRNHTTLSFYHEKPTVHPGAASVSTHHVSGHSASHQAAKCTTTFQRSPTQACTSTRYAHTKTIAVDCYGCVGEQAQVTKEEYHEGKVRIVSITNRFTCNTTNRCQQICNNTTTVTIPISRKSVCAGPMVATGGSVVSKSKSSSAHVASSGFVTSTSAGVHGSQYGTGNWTGLG
jgi:hypothetical protein